MPTPEEILSDADAAARQFAIGLASQKGTSGIRPPPQIEVSEVTLDPKKFKIDLDRSADAAEAGDEGGGGGPIIEPEGACCQEDGSCDDIGELACDAAGGEWQGEGTTCDETTCPVHEGACCVEDSCDILTPSDCEAAGGTYQGDDVPCDPDPCMPPCGSCGFDAFDGSGRKFHTQTWTVDGHYHWEGEDAVCGHTDCTLTINFTKTSSYDPTTCVLTTTCTGSFTFDTTEGGGGAGQHTSGDWCTDHSVGCGFCAGSCDIPNPTDSMPTCSTSGCSCTADTITCSTSGSTMGDCNCAAGRPPTINGSCTLTQTVTLSDECTP